MPAYNSGKYISYSIESVLEQTFQDWTLIISDDGSDDETVRIARVYAMKDPRIEVLLSEERATGAANTRNRALAVAKGDYIAFLDSDDLWKPEKLEKQIEFMQQNDLAFSCTEFDAIDDNGLAINKNQRGKDVLSYEDLLKHRGMIGCLTVVYDRHKCGNILMPIIRKRQDYAMWLTILKQGHSSHRLNEKLSVYRVRKGSISSNKISAAKYMWRVYREVESFSFFKSAFYFLHYAVYHVRGILRI